MAVPSSWGIACNSSPSIRWSKPSCERKTSSATPARCTCPGPRRRRSLCHRREDAMTEIRELNEGDLAAWVRVGAQAYRRGDRGEGLPSWPTGNFTRYGLFEASEQVAQ